MKKSNFFAFAALGLLTLASCSDSNDPIVEGGEQETGEQIIVLDMQDTDVLSTKSRPLYSTSNKGAEQVTDLKLLMFKINADNTKTLIKAIDLPNWDQRSSDYNYGRKLSIRLTGEERLKIGNDSGDDINDGESFTIVAVGQDEKTKTPAPFTFGIPSGGSTNLPGLNFGALTGDDRKWNSIQEAGKGYKWLFTNPIKTYETPASEIFSGESNPTTIQLDGGFQANVLLKRQVAGVMGYFSRIPATVLSADGKPLVVRYIRLVASARNTQLDLTVNLPQQEDDATEKESSDAETVMNGFSSDGHAATANAAFEATASTTDAYTVYAIDLAKWFPGAWDTQNSKWDDKAVKDDLLDVSSYWVNDIDPTNANPILADCSVFAGEFTIPFKQVESKNTFELQLLSTESIILKKWNVKLDRASWNSAKKDGADVYNIYRNHLYQIGKRGDTDTPDNPGTDPDKPQPLDKDQDLTIYINDEWEFIHDMEIE